MVTRLSLAGLSQAGGVALALERHPAMPAEVAVRLWEHTGGNPLYLNALLAEHSVGELSQMRMLPAPAEYAHDVGARLAGEPAEVRQLAAGAAVLGSGRVAVHEAGAVAEVDDAWDAVQRLAESGLAEAGDAGGVATLRWAHALTRAAVYQQIGLAQRRTLHARAAAVVTTQTAVFEHRMAAAGQYDETLASELQTHAGGLHAHRSYRLAAQYLLWASALTSDRGLRQARWLDSRFEAVLAQDFAAVEADLADVRESMDLGRRVLVLGAMSCLQARSQEGVAELAAVTDWGPEVSDPLTRVRIEALLAWGRTILGQDVALIEAGLARAAVLGVQDPALLSYLLLARGHVAGRRGAWGGFAAQLSQLPAVASATPAELSGLLVWRGSDRLARGAVSDAISDLREVQHRQHDGMVDFLSNGFDALLGGAYWFQGRWDLAQVVLRQAREVPAELVGLLTYAAAPLAACAAGDYHRAEEELDAAADVLEQRPWQEAVELHVAVRVVQLHAAGTRAKQATLLADVRRRWPATELGGGLNDGLWQIHLAIAHLWAGEPDAAAGRLQRAEALQPQDTSLTACTRWLRGLLAEAGGDHTAALEHLRAAAGLDSTQLPLYQAHILADHARTAAAAGHGIEADVSRAAAAEIYRHLGATHYLARLDAHPAPAPAGAEPAYVLHLTEREHDVLTLVVEGYSYKQVSQELFISQSTVSYHLSNIYPKAGVSSRHELTRWVREHPASVSVTTTPARPPAA